MEFIKKHKIAFIVTGVILVLLILGIWGIKSAFFSNINSSKYGNRLDGIENYPITNDNIEDIKKMLMDTGYANTVNYNLSGRIIKFTIKIKPDTDLTTSRSLADKIAEKFTDEIKSFYDIEIYIDTDEESEIYPTIGYKHKSSVGFKWNN